jgi:Fur family transcriptional regulator, ferric uptake regulator
MSQISASKPTRTSDLPEVVQPLCAVFRTALRREGLKYTAERASLLDVVMRMAGAFTVDDVLQQIKLQASKAKGPAPKVSKATAYRTIKLLAECGIIQPLPGIGELTRFVLAFGRPADALIVPDDGGAAMAVNAAELTTLCEELCAKRGLKLTGQSIVLYVEKRH